MDTMFSELSGKLKMHLVLFGLEIQALKILTADGTPKPYSQAHKDDPCEIFYYDDTCRREYHEQIGYPLLHDGITPQEHEELNEPLSNLYWEAHQELSGLHIDVVLSEKCGWFLLLYADGIEGAMIENGEVFWQ